MKIKLLVLILPVALCSCGTDRVTPPTNSNDTVVGQYLTYLYDSLKQENAIQRANADFTEGKYYILDFGESAGVPDLDRNIDSLYATFGVRALQAGCVVRQPARTYSDEMLRLLETNKDITASSIFGMMYFDERKEERRLRWMADSARLEDSLRNLDTAK